MDHPLILEGHFDLRKRVIQFIKSSYVVRKASNIIFVCGGNDKQHMRMRFRSYCEENLKEYDIFFPEFAMKNYFTGEAVEPFDIVDFEVLVGNLSEAIVIFPEAPGSFAEVGYFSAIDSLSQRSILALDQKLQGPDSFISLGPAKKIGAKSFYHPIIQLNYTDPEFHDIRDRIKRLNPLKPRKLFELNTFSNLTSFELFCLLHEIINLMIVATFEDIKYILNGIFKSQISIPAVKKILSILVGSEYLIEVGTFGHLSKHKGKSNLLDIREGNKDELDKIRLDVTDICYSYKPDFVKIVEAAQDAN